MNARINDFFSPQHKITEKQSQREELQKHLLAYKGTIEVMPSPAFTPKRPAKQLLNIWAYCDYPEPKKAVKRDTTIARVDAMPLCGFDPLIRSHQDAFNRLSDEGVIPTAKVVKTVGGKTLRRYNPHEMNRKYFTDWIGR